MNNIPITVSSPLLPPLEEFIPYLKDIWDRKWLTNNGYYHQELEKALSNYLGVEFISLFTNGTLPIITALQALNIKGEVITTPYSFVATTHALWWNGIKPVFVDIDPLTGNIDPSKIEQAITPLTSAILPVHVYGNPCDIKEIQRIAKKHNLKVIYDAAHAFGVTINGESVLKWGDFSTISFHATKTYNTIEGGALISQNREAKQYIDYLKNFGFAGETNVIAAGINSKMDEVRAAFGLLNLNYVDSAIEFRSRVAKKYRETLAGVNGISFISDIPGVRHNYSYFPVFVDKNVYGMNRDELYEKMKSQNVFGRRYFYPLISSFAMYKDLPSASQVNLPVSNHFADTVICLPMHANLLDEDVERVLDCIVK